MLFVFLCELFPVNKIGFGALIWFPKAALTATLPTARSSASFCKITCLRISCWCDLELWKVSLIAVSVSTKRTLAIDELPCLVLSSKQQPISLKPLGASQILLFMTGLLLARFAAQRVDG